MISREEKALLLGRAIDRIRGPEPEEKEIWYSWPPLKTQEKSQEIIAEILIESLKSLIELAECGKEIKSLAIAYKTIDGKVTEIKEINSVIHRRERRGKENACRKTNKVQT